MAIIKKGKADQFTWGIPSGTTTVSGRIVSVRNSRSIEKEVLQNQEGETDGVVYLDSSSSGTVEAILPEAGTETLELAANITINGKVCYVESIEKSYERRGFAKFTISYSGWDAVSAT